MLLLSTFKFVFFCNLIKDIQSVVVFENSYGNKLAVGIFTTYPPDAANVSHSKLLKLIDGNTFRNYNSTYRCYGQCYQYPSYKLYSVSITKELVALSLNWLLSPEFLYLTTDGYYSNKVIGVYSYLNESETKLLSYILSAVDMLMFDGNIENKDNVINRGLGHSYFCEPPTNSIDTLAEVIDEMQWQKIVMISMYMTKSYRIENEKFANHLRKRFPELCLQSYQIKFNNFTVLNKTLNNIFSNELRPPYYLKFDPLISVKDLKTFYELILPYNIEKNTFITDQDDRKGYLYYWYPQTSPFVDGLLTLPNQLIHVPTEYLYSDAEINSYMFLEAAFRLFSNGFYLRSSFFAYQQLCFGTIPISYYMVLSSGRLARYVYDTSRIKSLLDRKKSNLRYNASCFKINCNIGFSGLVTSLEDGNSEINYWKCFPCEHMHIKAISGNSSCIKCPFETVPTVERSKCFDPTPFIYFDYTEQRGIAVLTIAAIGFVLALCMLVIFGKYRDTPVVKSANLSIACFQFLLHAVIFATVPIYFIGEPTSLICKLRHIPTGFLFTLVCSLMLIKSKKLVFIFNAKIKLTTAKKNQEMMTDVLLVVALVSVQISSSIITSILFPSKLAIVKNKMLNYRIVTCSTDISLLMQMIIIIFLSFLCVLNGFRARNLPTSYNETQYVTFSMMTSNLTLILMFPIYYSASTYIEKCFITSICLMVTNGIIMIVMFFFKLFIIIFKKEQNTKEYFQKMMASYSYKQTSSKLDKKISKVI